MTKIFDNGDSLRQKILKGMEILYKNVKSTIGPNGKTVILYSKNKNPIITKDGITVANFIDSEDPFENLGIQILKQSAQKTSLACGDRDITNNYSCLFYF